MKNKQVIIISITALLIIFILSCKKEPGSGGNSSIKGKVWVKQYDLTFENILRQFNGADVDVYIIYGDEVSYGDRVKSDYEGDFEFKYLRKGSYKIYAYSKDSAEAWAGGSVKTDLPPKAIVKDVMVTDKKQTVDVETITIGINN